MNIILENQKAVDFFLKRWDETDKVIDFDDSWIVPPKPSLVEAFEKIGAVFVHLTGAWNDPAVKALKNGEVAKAITDDGIKILIVQTRFKAAIFHLINSNNGIRIWPDYSEQLTFVQPYRPLIRMALVRRVIGTKGGTKKFSNIRHLNIGELVERQAKLFYYEDYRPTVEDFYLSVTKEQNKSEIKS